MFVYNYAYVHFICTMKIFIMIVNINYVTVLIKVYFPQPATHTESSLCSYQNVHDRELREKYQNIYTVYCHTLSNLVRFLNSTYIHVCGKTVLRY